MENVIIICLLLTWWSSSYLDYLFLNLAAWTRISKSTLSVSYASTCLSESRALPRYDGQAIKLIKVNPLVPYAHYREHQDKPFSLQIQRLEVDLKFNCGFLFFAPWVKTSTALLLSKFELAHEFYYIFIWLSAIVELKNCRQQFCYFFTF